MSAEDADTLVEEKTTAEFYEILSKGRDKKLSANWMITELFGALNKSGLELNESKVDADALEI